MKRFLILAALGLSGCAAMITVRGTEPTGEWLSSKSLDETAACVVAAMDSVDSLISNSIQVKTPHKVYEVSAPQSAVEGATIYYASLTAEGTRTRIQLFSRGYSTTQMKPAVARCGA